MTADRTRIDGTPLAAKEWRKAIRNAAKLYDVAEESVAGRSRLPRLVMARHEAWTTLRLGGWGWEEIAITTGFERSAVRGGVLHYARLTGLVLK